MTKQDINNFIENKNLIHTIDKKSLFRYQKKLKNYIFSSLKEGRMENFEAVDNFLSCTDLLNSIKPEEEMELAKNIFKNKNNAQKTVELYFKFFNQKQENMKHYICGLYTYCLFFLDEGLKNNNSSIIDYLITTSKQPVNYLYVNVPLLDNPDLIRFCKSRNLDFSEQSINYDKKINLSNLHQTKKLITSLYELDDFFENKKEHLSYEKYIETLKNLLKDFLMFNEQKNVRKNVFFENLCHLLKKNKVQFLDFSFYLLNSSIIEPTNFNLFKELDLGISDKEIDFLILCTLHTTIKKAQKFCYNLDYKDKKIIGNKIKNNEYRYTNFIIEQGLIEHMTFLQDCFEFNFDLTHKNLSNNANANTEINIKRNKIHTHTDFWVKAIESQKISIPQCLFIYNFYSHDYTEVIKNLKQDVSFFFNNRLLLDSMQYISQFFSATNPAIAHQFFFNIQSKMGIESEQIKEVYNSIDLNYIPIEFQKGYALFEEYDTLKNIVNQTNTGLNSKKRL